MRAEASSEAGAEVREREVLDEAVTRVMTMFPHMTDNEAAAQVEAVRRDHPTWSAKQFAAAVEAEFFPPEVKQMLQEVEKCQGSTRHGNPCGNKAAIGKSYCWTHRDLNKASDRTMPTGSDGAPSTVIHGVASAPPARTAQATASAPPARTAQATASAPPARTAQATASAPPARTAQATASAPPAR
ncbi:hypothetical protein CYMTET_28021, partial [Cymbomonas tetramitiformis]